MPTKRYVVTLTSDERDQLDTLTRAGRRSARTIARARILLLTDQGDGGLGWEDRRVAEALGCGHRTVERIRERFVILHLPRRPFGRSRRLCYGVFLFATLIATACSGGNRLEQLVLRETDNVRRRIGPSQTRSGRVLLEVIALSYNQEDTGLRQKTEVRGPSSPHQRSANERKRGTRINISCVRSRQGRDKSLDRHPRVATVRRRRCLRVATNLGLPDVQATASIAECLPVEECLPRNG